jgi:hypothetical protein
MILVLRRSNSGYCWGYPKTTRQKAFKRDWRVFLAKSPYQFARCRDGRALFRCPIQRGGQGGIGLVLSEARLRSLTNRYPQGPAFRHFIRSRHFAADGFNPVAMMPMMAPNGRHHECVAVGFWCATKSDSRRYRGRRNLAGVTREKPLENKRQGQPGQHDHCEFLLETQPPPKLPEDLAEGVVAKSPASDELVAVATESFQIADRCTPGSIIGLVALRPKNLPCVVVSSSANLRVAVWLSSHAILAPGLMYTWLSPPIPIRDGPPASPLDRGTPSIADPHAHSRRNTPPNVRGLVSRTRKRLRGPYRSGGRSVSPQILMLSMLTEKAMEIPSRFRPFPSNITGRRSSKQLLKHSGIIQFEPLSELVNVEHIR